MACAVHKQGYENNLSFISLQSVALLVQTLQSANIQQLSDINTHVQSMLLLMLQISKITATVCNLWCQSNDCLEDKDQVCVY